MYKDQHQIQRIIILGSYNNDLKDWREEKTKVDRWEELSPIVDKIIGDTDKVIRMMMAYGNDKQREFISRVNRSSRVILTGEFDPRSKQAIGFADWDVMLTLMGYAVEGHCKMCMKNKDAVRKCALRLALKNLGAEYDKNLIGTCSCEFSRV